jgi:hypothetical protein
MLNGNNDPKVIEIGLMTAIVSGAGLIAFLSMSIG